MNMPIEFVEAVDSLKRIVFKYELLKQWHMEFYERLAVKYPQIVIEIESEMGTSEGEE